jgi:septum formation inhibitor-activating ATPase MinD
MSARVIVIAGSKGGSGATTIAFEMIKRLGPGSARGVLVDGDLAGRRSHAVTYDVVRQLDESRAPGTPALSPAPDCDLFELANSFEDGYSVKADAVEALIAKLPTETTFVADLPQLFAGAVRPFVTRALRFAVVVEPTLLGVSAARQLLHAMARFGIPPNRIVIVLNNRDGNVELKRNEIQVTLQAPVIGEIPPRRDRGYGRAIQSLSEVLLKVPHLEPLPNLRPSASIPIGDRRVTSRSALGSGSISLVAGSVTSVVVASDARATVATRPAGTNDSVKNRIHESLMSRIDFGVAARMFTDAAKMVELRAQVKDVVSELISECKDIGSVEEAARIKQEIVQEALGLGADRKPDARPLRYRNHGERIP